jgi:hypothetical protein
MPLHDSCIYDECRFRNGLKFLRNVKTLEALQRKVNLKLQL